MNTLKHLAQWSLGTQLDRLSLKYFESNPGRHITYFFGLISKGVFRYKMIKKWNIGKERVFVS